jgi:hypothetical protein
MAQIFVDVTRQLREDQRHISNSIDRVSKSTDILVRMQQHIRASVALIERAGSLKWPMNVSTLPRRIDTLQAQNSRSESKSS